MGETFSCGQRLSRTLAMIGIIATGLLLAVVAYLLRREQNWNPPAELSDRDAFTFGSIGTELIPLPVLQVLPQLVRDRRHLSPLGENAGDWIEQFGFVRGEKGLPFGFTVSHYRPQTGAASPVEFVGIGCATCHASEIIGPDGKARIVLGTGNSSVNLFAWLDALQAAILDKQSLPDKQEVFVVTAEGVTEAFEKQDRKLSVAERLMIGFWLNAFRKDLEAKLPRFDDPFGKGHSLEPAVTPTGPGRTQPFRTLVRTVLQRPGNNMHVYTKTATVFHQDPNEWAQVDGGIRGLESRSALAVLAAGATLENMRVPEIQQNIRKATSFVRSLAGPKFVETFPDEKLDLPAVARGKQVYRTACASCHGQPNDQGGWIKGKRQGEIVPLEEIRTDPERADFRHGNELPQRLFDYFPDDHPFKFPRSDIRAPRGYINKPIDAAFCRAPFLHNGSVLTLAELINLVPRQTTFYRGRNTFDPTNVGLSSTSGPTDRVYFRFDTSESGNANTGHDYPWPYQGEGWDKAQLIDLLEYLKTI